MMSLDFLNGDSNNQHGKNLRNFRKQTFHSTHGIVNRLRSITDDSTAATTFHQTSVPHFPIFANKRCGQWYVPPTIPKTTITTFPSLSISQPIDSTTSITTENTEPVPTTTSYFKSTDGHFNVWNFPVSRLNMAVFERVTATHTSLNITTEFEQYMTQFKINSPPLVKTSLPLAIPLRGGVIIDSTRKGKEFPDSFTRTIPIWASVLNHSFLHIPTLTSPSEFVAYNAQQPHGQLSGDRPKHSLTSPQWMSGSETDQISIKVIQTHAKTFLNNLGYDAYRHYSSDFIRVQPIGPNGHHNTAIMSQLTPIWVHRESYQSTFQILNQNTALMIQQHLLPIITDAIASPFATPMIGLAVEFVIALVYKYNLGIYLNLVNYYNTTPNTTQATTIVEHFKSNFTSAIDERVMLLTKCTDGDDTTDEKTDQSKHSIQPTTQRTTTATALSISAAILSTLMPFFQIPLILYSASLVDRFERTYAGENTATYRAVDHSHPTDDPHTCQSCIDLNFIPVSPSTSFSGSPATLGEDGDKFDNTINSGSTGHNTPGTTPSTPKLNISRRLSRSGSIGNELSSNEKQYYCPYTFSPIPQHASHTTPLSQLALSIKYPYRTDFIDQNEKNQCRDLDYIPGAGDDEETWCKIKVWGLKTPAEMGWEDQPLGGKSSLGSDIATDDNQEKHRSVILDEPESTTGADISDSIDHRSMSCTSQNLIQIRANAISAVDYDDTASIVERDGEEEDDDDAPFEFDDDSQFKSDREIHAELPLVLFSTTIPPRQAKFYKRVVMQCDFTMLYPKHIEQANGQLFDLAQCAHDAIDSEHCWSVLYQQVYMAQPSKHDLNSNTDCLFTLSGSSDDGDEDKLMIDFTPAKTTPIFQIQSVSHNQTVTIYSIRVPLATQLVKAVNQLEERSDGEITPVNPTKLVIFEAQNPGVIPAVSDLIQACDKLSPESALTASQCKMSFHHSVKQTILNNLSELLASLITPITNGNNSISPIKSNTDILFTNSSPELSTTVIIALVLFLSQGSTISNEKEILPTTPSTPSTPPDPALLADMPQITETTLTPITPTSTLASTTSIAPPPTTTCLSTATSPSLTTHCLTVPTFSDTYPQLESTPFPSGLHTTRATHSKHYIRQVSSYVITTLNKNLGAVFPPREAQQQLNLYFCPQVRPPPTSRGGKKK